MWFEIFVIGFSCFLMVKFCDYWGFGLEYMGGFCEIGSFGLCLVAERKCVEKIGVEIFGC